MLVNTLCTYSLLPFHSMIHDSALHLNLLHVLSATYVDYLFFVLCVAYKTGFTQLPRLHPLDDQ